MTKHSFTATRTNRIARCKTESGCSVLRSLWISVNEQIWKEDKIATVVKSTPPTWKTPCIFSRCSSERNDRTIKENEVKQARHHQRARFLLNSIARHSVKERKKTSMSGKGKRELYKYAHDKPKKESWHKKTQLLIYLRLKYKLGGLI